MITNTCLNNICFLIDLLIKKTPFYAWVEVNFSIVNVMLWVWVCKVYSTFNLYEMNAQLQQKRGSKLIIFNENNTVAKTFIVVYDALQ